MKNILFKNTLSTLFISTALALAGCSGNAQEAAPAATQAQGTVAPVAATAHGQVKFVGDALSQVPLRPEQRVEIEKLAADADARHEAARKAQSDVMLTVADQVEHGTIDRTALQPKIDAAVTAHEQARPQDRAAFQRLHDLLDASQREAFANAMKDKMQAAHGNWQAQTEGASAKTEGHEHHGFAHMKQLADDLKLTDDQRSQIRDIMRTEFQKNGAKGMHEMAKGHEHMSDVMEQFKADQFSAEKMASPIDMRAKVSEGTTKAVDIAEKVLPILTPEQRTLAAAKIREHVASGKAPF